MGWLRSWHPEMQRCDDEKCKPDGHENVTCTACIMADGTPYLQRGDFLQCGAHECTACSSLSAARTQLDSPAARVLP
jgi:hypothetical protein